MRCPQCRQRAHPRRWWRLPATLKCFHCGAHLIRNGRLSVGEGLLVWLLVMLPGTLTAWLGGVTGFVLGGFLALAILPVRPWDGLRYGLVDGKSSGLPIAVAHRPALAPAAEASEPDLSDVSG